MISDFREYHRLTAYLACRSDRPIGLAMGLGNLRHLFEEQYYQDLDGGILESFGRLFKEQVKIFVYPHKDERSGTIERLDHVKFRGNLRHLFRYLKDRGYLVGLQEASGKNLDIRSPNVLRLIAAGDPAWLKMVPARVAARIRSQKLFGHHGILQ